MIKSLEIKQTEKSPPKNREKEAVQEIKSYVLLFASIVNGIDAAAILS